MALAIGNTERTALKIAGELDTEDYIRRQRKGRLNVYRVNRGVPARNVQSRVPVGGLLTVISSSGHGIMDEVDQARPQEPPSVVWSRLRPPSTWNLFDPFFGGL